MIAKYGGGGLELFARSTGLTVVLGILVSGSIGLFLGVMPWNPIVVAALAVTVVVVLPITYESLSRGFDVISPLTIFAGTWIVMFPLRALVNVRNGDTTLRGRYEVEESYVPALALAAAGALFFYVGFYAFGPQRISKREQSPQVRSVNQDFVWIAFLMLIPVSLITLGLRAGVVERTSAYLYMMPLALIGCGLLLIATGAGGKSKWVLVGFLVIGVFLFDALVNASRFYALLAVGAVGYFYVTSRGKRLSIISVLLAGAAAVFLIIGPVLIWGSSEAQSLPTRERVELAVSSIPRSWELFAEGATNEMLPALALLLQTNGTIWEHEPGQLITQLASHWIPRSVWPDKPFSIPEHVYSVFFPEYFARARNNVQLSILGEFYFDSGIVGVVLGMTAYGALAGVVWRQFLLRQSSVLAHVLYAPFPLFLLYLLRGNTALILSMALFVYLPLFAVVARRVLAKEHSTSHVGRKVQQ